MARFVSPHLQAYERRRAMGSALSRRCWHRVLLDGVGAGGVSSAVVPTEPGGHGREGILQDAAALASLPSHHAAAPTARATHPHRHRDQQGSRVFPAMRKSRLLPLDLYFTVCTDLNSGPQSTVISTPVITTQPTAQTVVLGAPATFSVVATADSLKYQWYKSAEAISGATSATYTIPADWPWRRVALPGPRRQLGRIDRQRYGATHGRRG